MSVDTSTEWETIERCRRGNAAAFEPLVRTHEGRALVLAEALLGSRDDAADAVQEAFVKAYRALGRLRPGSSFGPWFRTILRNHCRDRLRSEAGRSAVAWEAEVVDPSAATLPTAPVELERAELAALVRTALAGLSPEHREVLILKEMEGMSYAEIARETGAPAGTIASRLHHARALLRERVLSGGALTEGADA
ncbi:MAG: sigma-70 family RNA polymerase sigma factor [Gemmatimonadota bacterium]